MLLVQKLEKLLHFKVDRDFWHTLYILLVERQFWTCNKKD